jgi:hypothetical protein
MMINDLVITFIIISMMTMLMFTTVVSFFILIVRLRVVVTIMYYSWMMVNNAWLINVNWRRVIIDLLTRVIKIWITQINI